MKRLRFLVCALLIMMLCSPSAFAANGPVGDTKDKADSTYDATEEEKAATIKADNETESRLKNDANKLRKAYKKYSLDESWLNDMFGNKGQKKKANKKTKAIFINCKLTPLKQERYYYCGPAMVKSMVKCIRGKASSQNYYARQMGTTTKGTDMDQVAACLKQKARKEYKYAKIKSMKKFKTRIFSNIIWRWVFGMKKIPVALDILPTASTWDYGTNGSGHFVSVSGMRTDAKRLRVSDSFLTKKEIRKAKNKTLGKHRKKATSNVYEVAMAHWQKRMIW